MSDSERVPEIKPDVNKSARTYRIQKLDLFQHVNSFADRVMFLQRTIGNQGVERMIRSGILQANFKIGQPGDQYEKEADRVAEQVMRMHEPQEVSGNNLHKELKKDISFDHALTIPITQRPLLLKERPESGSIQRFPWLIAGAVAAIAAAGYAWWAYNCLHPCEDPMYRATYGNAARTGGFRLWYYNQTNAPVPGRVWDAFGHCFVACCGTKRCGATTTAIAGKGREFYREHIDSDSHDSYEQDTNNQTLGRGFGDQGLDCEDACRNAAMPGGAMDLSAPITEYWTPAEGRTVPRQPTPRF